MREHPERGRGRPPIGERAMTRAERNERHAAKCRAIRQAAAGYIDAKDAWLAQVASPGRGAGRAKASTAAMRAYHAAELDLREALGRPRDLTPRRTT